LTVAGQGSLRIVSRKYSKCGARLLDDAFARYKKLDQTKYVVRQLKMGCGSPGCNQKRILVIPFDESLKYYVPDINQLNRKLKETPGWEKYFVRTREDCLENEISSTTKTTCSKCHEEGERSGPRITDENARWTINKSPAYLLRKPKGCGKHKTAVFVPIDLSIPNIHTASLTKLWKKVEKGILQLEEVKFNFDHFFGVTHGNSSA